MIFIILAPPTAHYQPVSAVTASGVKQYVESTGMDVECVIANTDFKSMVQCPRFRKLVV